MRRITRREFGALVATGLVSGRLGAQIAAAGGRGAPVTAGEVLERIRRGVGVEWQAETADTVKAGDPSTPVTGIVTTALATLDVLRRAGDAGANLVVTCEPVFYGRADRRTPPAGPPGAPAAPGPDPVYEAKNRLIDARGLVVFRFGEHWRRRRPDPFAQGLAEVLRWSRHRVPGDAPRFDIPPVSLAEFARGVKHALGARGGVRVVGDPAARVRRVGLLPGSTPIGAALRAMPAADVVLAGEVREWESVEYARDLAHARTGKGLVLVGRVLSQEPGMKACADWLRALVPEVPVQHLPAGDPYWRPAA